MNFNYTKEQYLALSEAEKAFIMRAYEEKSIENLYAMRNSFYNAYINANRKKGKKEIPLIKKKQVKKGNINERDDLFNRVERFEKKM